jgi:hypothetical protein
MASFRLFGHAILSLAFKGAIRISLKRRNQLSHELIEVKSATDIKLQYAYDVGIQEYVLANAGIKIERSTVMHLNREYVFDGNALSYASPFLNFIS